MATNSPSTPFWYGELYGDTVPSYTIFKHEWPDHYFTDDDPMEGRAFGIFRGGELIGQVNYNRIDPHNIETDLDIIIADPTQHSKGYGSEALILLIDFLFTELNLKRCKAEVLTLNPKAFRCFKRAGFVWAYTYASQEREWRVLELRRSVWTMRKETERKERW